MISGIILAAGDSKRMGKDKAILKYKGKTFIENICSNLALAGFCDIIVVLGKSKDKILSVWKPENAKVVINPNSELGQLSSLRTGIKNIQPKSEAFMVVLADQPTIPAKTYKAIADYWLLNKDCIVIPRTARETGVRKSENKPRIPRAAPGIKYKRGHPIIIPLIYRNLCFEGPLEKGLHWVTHHPEVKVKDFDTDDKSILKDFDTPEDYMFV